MEQKTNPENEINDLLKGYTKKMDVETEVEQEAPRKKRGRPRKEKEPDTIEDSNLISGALFLLLIDLAIPALLSMANNMMVKDKRKKIKAKTLKMTKEQREELAPIADEAVKQLMLQASPLAVFLVSIIGIYGLNFMMLKSE